MEGMSDRVAASAAAGTLRLPLQVEPLDDAERDASKRRFLATLDPDAPLHLFGYGSLMWDPGFHHEHSCDAQLFGYHRAFCVYSHRYRGTPERPGLVLGLDRGGSCWGMLYKIAPSQVAAAVDYLWEREMVTGVYQARRVTVCTRVGARLDCHAFVVDRAHTQYTGRMAAAATAELIVQGYGRRGACRDYLANTVSHLDDLGFRDGPLHRLLDLVDERCDRRRRG